MLSGIVDLHSHFIPGVDDGARSPEEGVRALRRMTAQGCGTCVTTPHFDASLTRNAAALERRLAEFDRGLDLLGSACAEYIQRNERADLPLLLRGTEVMLDEPEPDLSNPKIRLAGGGFVLCEFPALRLPANPELAVRALVSQGWRPLIAHPERYRNVDESLEALQRMREAGAQFQVNAGSITGKYGPQAQALAWRILEAGWAACVASDYHARGAPQLAAAVVALEPIGGRALVETLFVENPRRMLIGADPVLPASWTREQSKSWWKRLLAKREP